MVKFLIAFCAITVLFIISGVIYLATGMGRRFYHDLLKWHMPDGKETFDGCSMHSHCKYCGEEIMQDSQGNWF